MVFILDIRDIRMCQLKEKMLHCPNMKYFVDQSMQKSAIVAGYDVQQSAT